MNLKLILNGSFGIHLVMVKEIESQICLLFINNNLQLNRYLVKFDMSRHLTLVENSMEDGREKKDNEKSEFGN